MDLLKCLSTETNHDILGLMYTQLTDTPIHIIGYLVVQDFQAVLDSLLKAAKLSGKNFVKFLCLHKKLKFNNVVKFYLAGSHIATSFNICMDVYSSYM